jgi:hypothetical protein
MEEEHPGTLPPLRVKVTVPVGVAAEPVTVAVNVTESFTLEFGDGDPPSVTVDVP